MNKWIQALEANNINYYKDELLAKHTTWRVGGPADALVLPVNRAQLVTTLEILNHYQVDWKVIGNGSNLLVSDRGYRGAVISLTSNFVDISVVDRIITVEANYSIAKLTRFALEHGLTGLEFACGIPGTVGGAVAMNIGAHGGEISNILIDAEILTATGETEVWSNEDFQFLYRDSRLKRQDAILLSARFLLDFAVVKQIKTKMESYNNRRRKSQPIGLNTAGSVFKNPENAFAGQLIENLGLKGRTSGGAEISLKHSNFIVNTGSATAQDICRLINYIKSEVLREYGIKLEMEIEIVGEC